MCVCWFFHAVDCVSSLFAFIISGGGGGGRRDFATGKSLVRVTLSELMTSSGSESLSGPLVW